MISVPRLSSRVALAATCLVTGLLAAPAAHAEDPGPIHAGNTFGWYPTAERYEFERWGEPKPLTHEWQTHGHSTEQGGQLTMTAYNGHSTTVTLRGAGHRKGRWELRMHGYDLRDAANHYRLTSSLIPASASERRCGPEMTFADITLPKSRAGFSLRPGDGSVYSTSTASRGESFGGREHWHTFAVEVTGKRISWFVDAHVIATQARPAAMAHVPFTVQLRLESTRDAGKGAMSRMQLDWLRYWTLRKPDSRSVAAPALHRTKAPAARSAC